MLRQAVVPALDTTLESPSWIRNLFIVLGGSFLIALFARIAIPLPFSPVPLALQGTVCLLLGAVLGSRRAAWAVLVYLLQGAAGLPVFALGHAGMAVLLGPRGGYLIGYLLGAYVTGYLVERSGSKNLRQAGLAMVIGNLMIYLCGLSQLSLFVGIERVFFLGMFPFIIGDCFKLFAACRVLKALKFK